MLGKIKLFLGSNRFLKNVLLVSGGTLVSQLLILILSPVISRIYNADDFGVYQQYQSILGVLIVIGSLRYDMAVLVPKKKIESFILLFTSIGINIAGFLILILVASLMDHFNVQLSFASGLSSFIWILPFAFLGAALYQTLTYAMVLDKEYAPISKTKIIQSGGLITGQIGGGLVLNKALGLFIGDLLSKFLGIYTFLKRLRPKLREHWRETTKQEVQALAKKYKKYPLVSAPGALLNSAGFAIPTLLIGDLFGLINLGYFSLVERVFNAPSVLVGQSVSQVYMGDFSELKSSNPTKLKKLFKSIVTKLFLISLVPMAIGYFFAPQLFVFIFGSEWEESGYFFRLLIPMQILGFITWPLIPTLNLLEKQRTQFLWELSRLVASTWILIYFSQKGTDVREAILGYSLVMTLFYALHLILSYYELSRLTYNHKKNESVNH